MANTTEELVALLKDSKLTVIKWVDGKPVKTYPKTGWGVNGKVTK